MHFSKAQYKYNLLHIHFIPTIQKITAAKHTNILAFVFVDL